VAVLIDALSLLPNLHGIILGNGPEYESLRARASDREVRDRITWIDDALYFVGLENSGGWIEGGDVAIRFEADGTTEYSLLEIADADDNHMTLVIEPLLDRVRRRNGPARS
jgi:hypothetical protein